MILQSLNNAKKDELIWLLRGMGYHLPVAHLTKDKIVELIEDRAEEVLDEECDPLADVDPRYALNITVVRIDSRHRTFHVNLTIDKRWNADMTMKVLGVVSEHCSTAFVYENSPWYLVNGAALLLSFLLARFVVILAAIVHAAGCWLELGVQRGDSGPVY